MILFFVICFVFIFVFAFLLVFFTYKMLHKKDECVCDGRRQQLTIYIYKKIQRQIQFDLVAQCCQIGEKDVKN